MNRKLITFISFFIILNHSFRSGFAQDDLIRDSAIINNIRANNINDLNNYVERYGPDLRFLNGEQTILSYAIVENNVTIVQYILNKGADINLILNNTSPLMLCAIHDRPNIASSLVKLGAKVDLYNKHRNTALLYASRYGNINTVKVLTQHRANPFFKNFIGYNSLDYARENHKDDVVEYLKTYMVRYAKGAFPSTYDGPHVDWIGLNRVKAYYIINDSTAGKIYKKSKIYRIKDSLVITGIYSLDTLDHIVYKPENKRDNNYLFQNVGKIFAIGDVHGSYDSLLKVLINNKIIDHNQNWTFGNGHVVFIGDLFDRGDKVTEVLWLAYRLWNQAPKYHGKVHLLLGNHELLILNKDYRYVNEKYTYLTRGKNIEYADLFSTNTLWGDFVRSFNAAIKIDSILFVHAGLTYYIVNKSISITELNRSVYQILNRKENDLITERTISIFTDAFSDKGIFWYRGYLAESPIVSKASQDELNTVLNYYAVKTMVVGHTEVNRIEALYNGGLIPINVPFDRVGIPKQALLIVNGKYFRCNSDGSKELIM